MDQTQQTITKVTELANYNNVSLINNTVFYENLFKVYQATVKDKKYYYYNIANKIKLPPLNLDLFEEYTATIKMPYTTFANFVYNKTPSDPNLIFVLWWLIKIFNPDKANKFYVEPGDVFLILKPEYTADFLKLLE